MASWAQLGLKAVAWAVALAWLARVWAAHRGLPGIADLRDVEWNRKAAATLTVIVPARNEERAIGACLGSLLAQDDSQIRIVAVDDRSTDGTGAVMDGLAAEHPERLRVIHLEELLAGWLGKSHAMAVAAQTTTTDFLLFTDGDVLFAPESLRRALVYAEQTQADHLVLAPTTIIRRWDEAGLLGFFQIFGLWGVRPWRVEDPDAMRDAIGIGAFNMVRRSAYEAIGGFASFPMEIVEDIGLGRRIKGAGLRQRMAFGRGLVRVHWASGALGLVNVMTKNMFSAFNFHVLLVGLACGWLVLFAMMPFVLVWVPGFWLPSLLTLAAIASAYRLFERASGLSAWNALLTPFAAAAFCYAVLRSMVTTLVQGGVIWRGTFYSLAELRRNMVPLLRRR